MRAIINFPIWVPLVGASQTSAASAPHVHAARPPADGQGLQNSESVTVTYKLRPSHWSAKRRPVAPVFLLPPGSFTIPRSYFGSIPKRGKHRGITLVEAVMAVLIVGIMLVAALRTVGASRISQLQIAGHARGHQLALEMMAEMNAEPYADLDHYARTDLAIVHLDGSALDGFTGWTCSISVTLANPSDPTQTSASDSGLKRVTVEVERHGVPMATLTTLRTE